MLTFSERAQRQTNPIGKQLFFLMEDKQSNLALSADVTSKAELLQLADAMGPTICVLKTHIDIIEDFDRDLIDELTAIAKRHHFLIFEDRKFADIGHTVQLQYESGIFEISRWADMVNFHLLPGPGILEGLRAADSKAERAFIVLSEMSSQGHFFTEDYRQAAVMLAENNAEDVIGFICQHQQSHDSRFIHMTPGVHLAQMGDTTGQQYRTPEQAIFEQGCDLIIVGRGIIEADDPLETARAYQTAGWSAYEKRLKFPSRGGVPEGRGG